MLTTVSPPCSHPIPSPPWHSTFIIKVEYKSAFADYMNHTFCLCVKPLRDIGEKRVFCSQFYISVHGHFSLFLVAGHRTL